MRANVPSEADRGLLGFISGARTPNRTILAIGWLLVLGGVALTVLLAVKAGRPHEIGSDFGFLWIAGKMWLAGADPYQPAFAAEATRAFTQTHGWSFVHPPQWWPIAAPLGALSFESATRIWRAASVVCLFVTGALLWSKTQRWDPPVTVVVRLAFLILLFSTEKIGAVFYLDQTGLVTLLGFACIVIGTAPGKLAFSAFGFFIIMAKPSLGLPMVFVGLADAQSRRGLLVAGIATAIACLPQFVDGIQEGFNRAFRFLHNIGGYNAPGTWNAPDKMNGLYHIFPAVPSLVALVLSGVIGLLLTWRLRQLDPRHDPAPAILLAGAATLAAIAPIHTYDMPFVMCVVLLLGRLRTEAAIPMVIGILLIHSAKRICRFMVPESEALAVAQAHVDSAGGVLLLAGTLLTAIRGWRPVAAAGEVRSTAAA